MFRCAPPSPASCKLLKISATRWWNVSHTTGSSDSPRIKDMIGRIWDRKGRIVSTFAAFPNLVPPHSQWHPQLRLPASFHMFEQAQAEVCLCVLLICSERKAGMPTFPVWKQGNIFLPAIVLTWSRKPFGWSHWQDLYFLLDLQPIYIYHLFLHHYTIHKYLQYLLAPLASASVLCVWPRQHSPVELECSPVAELPVAHGTHQPPVVPSPDMAHWLVVLAVSNHSAGIRVSLAYHFDQTSVSVDLFSWSFQWISRISLYPKISQDQQRRGRWARGRQRWACIGATTAAGGRPSGVDFPKNALHKSIGTNLAICMWQTSKLNASNPIIIHQWRVWIQLNPCDLGKVCDNKRFG